MKAYEGVDIEIHVLFISVLVGGEWPVSCLCCFTHVESAYSTHWIGVGWAPELVWMIWRSENS
jgi:hypothetical protein